MQRPAGNYSHVTGLLWIGISTVVSGTVTYVVLRSTISQTGPFGLWDPICFELLGWWWVYYYLLSIPERTRWPKPFVLYTLRRFLDPASAMRSGKEKLTATEEEVVREKARSSRDVQGIMIAVVVLLLTITMSPSNEYRPAWIDHYGMMIHSTLFTLAVLIIVCWIISIDIFDTIMNHFRSPQLDDGTDIRRYFYRQLAPAGQHVISGGVSYGYLGLTMMTIFVPMSLSYFVPALGGYSTALYVYLAYPYYYGYYGTEQADQEEIVTLDRRTRWPSLTLGVALLVGTIITQTWS
jgi:hypothetical protein